METLNEWVRNIFIIIITLTFVEMILPENRIKNFVKYIFALVIMATILSPLMPLLSKI